VKRTSYEAPHYAAFSNLLLLQLLIMQPSPASCYFNIPVRTL